MSRYSVGVARAAPTAGTAIVGIRPGAGVDVQVREIGLTANAATSMTFGLIRTLTTGTANASTLFQPTDPGRSASTTNLDTGYSTAPTIGAIYLRRMWNANVIGAGVIWTFAPEELIVKAGATTQLLLWAITAGPALDLYVSIDE